MEAETSSREFFLSEEELVIALKNHNEGALEILYNMYHKPLFDILTMMLKEHASEQLLHDVFVEIWNSIHEYDAGKCRLFTWMFRLTRNYVLSIPYTKSIIQAS